VDAEYNGWPYQRGGPPGPPPELIPARAWVKSTHHAWFESATLATFGRLARALTKNVIFLFPKSKIDTTNRKGFPARASSPSAEGTGASALAQRFGSPQKPACAPQTPTHACLDGARLAGTSDGQAFYSLCYPDANCGPTEDSASFPSGGCGGGVGDGDGGSHGTVAGLPCSAESGGGGGCGMSAAAAAAVARWATRRAIRPGLPSKLGQGLC